MLRMILFTLFIKSSFAFTLTPLTKTINFGLNKNTVVYQVENKTNKPVALEISLKKRLMNSDGSEKRPEVDSANFLLFPNQLILKPKQKRGIKVQYLGKKPNVERAYRLVVEQLPVDFKKEKTSGVKLLLKYLGALYVSTDSFKPKLSIESLNG